MIYMKIYLDCDEDGTDVLVFDTVKNEIEGIFEKAGYREEERVFKLRSTVYGFANIAISPEAKTALSARLEDDTMYDGVYGESEFFLNFFDEFFAFMPSCVKQFVMDEDADLPYYEDCDTERRLRMDERFSYYMGNGAPLTWSLDDMTEAHNKLLKELDLSSPVDAGMLEA